MAYPALKVQPGNAGDPFRGQYRGYTRLGPSIVTVLQPPVGFTDRATGTVYYPTSRVVSGKERLVWSTDLPAGRIGSAKVFPAGEEPFLSNTGYRLFVRSGRLGYDTPAQAYASASVLWPSLTSWWTTRYILQQPVGFSSHGRLAFETAPEF